MKCLIIASGQGTRLASRTDLKPLARLIGMPLIARVILGAKRAGLDDFYVVTGYNGDRLKKYLKKFARKRNIKITCLNNEQWHKENGLSVLKAKDVIKEKFILLMSDHIFNERIIKKLMAQDIGAGEIILAVDKNINNSLVDKDDATKVLIDNDRIVDIGKEIKNYNAYDTGIFLCTPALFDALEQSAQQGDTTLSGGVRVLVQKGLARSFDIDGDYWIDVDDEVKLEQAENFLIHKLLSKPTDGFIARYINRPISQLVTKFLVRTGISPNLVSLGCFFISLIGAGFLFLGGYINLLVGVFLAQLSSILDGCDGELARLKFMESEFGGWFDSVLDRYADALLLLGLTYHSYITYSHPGIWLLIGSFAIIGSLINSYTAIRYDRFMIEYRNSWMRIGRDLRIFIIFILGILNLPGLALVIIASIMNIENLRRIFILSNA